MHAHAALGVLAGTGNLGDGHGGSVGAENRIGLADLAQLLKGVLLQAHDFGNGLDHEVSGATPSSSTVVEMFAMMASAAS